MRGRRCYAGSLLHLIHIPPATSPRNGLASEDTIVEHLLHVLADGPLTDDISLLPLTITLERYHNVLDRPWDIVGAHHMKDLLG